MADRFESSASGLDSPAQQAFAITPGTAELAETTRGIYVGGTGDISVEMKSGALVVFQEVPAGSLLPIRVVKIFAEGTSASAIVGLV